MIILVRLRFTRVATVAVQLAKTVDIKASSESEALSKLQVQLKKDMKKIQVAVGKASKKAARRSARAIAANAPKAFGELRDSIEVKVEGDNVAIEVNAPHAAAVEAGSRPHWIPLDDIIEWVRLRANQNWHHGKSTPYERGSTTEKHIRSIRAMVKAERKASGGSREDAIISVAKAIQYAISRAGTKPHWYVKGALPAVAEVLADEIEQELNKDA